jgi:hypothetical protein
MDHPSQKLIILSTQWYQHQQMSMKESRPRRNKVENKTIWTFPKNGDVQEASELTSQCLC